MTAPSNNQVRKAGEAIRSYLRGDSADWKAYAEAVDLVERHRAAHQKPLVTANNGLRSMVRTTGCDGQVTQRLKRMSTIIDKLEREPRLALERMQDIGGCRVILPDLDQLAAVRSHILKVHPEARESDYVATPRASGYRAIHLVLKYGSEPKPVEVQLRTVPMHQWAVLVEEYSGAVNVNYKQDGDSTFQRFALALSRIIELEETGVPVPRELLDQYAALIGEVFPRP